MRDHLTIAAEIVAAHVVRPDIVETLRALANTPPLALTASEREAVDDAADIVRVVAPLANDGRRAEMIETAATLRALLARADAATADADAALRNLAIIGALYVSGAWGARTETTEDEAYNTTLADAVESWEDRGLRLVDNAIADEATFRYARALAGEAGEAA